MTQVSLGVNLPLLSKTKSSKKIKREPLPLFLPRTNFRTNGEPNITDSIVEAPKQERVGCGGLAATCMYGTARQRACSALSTGYESEELKTQKLA